MKRKLKCISLYYVLPSDRTLDILKIGVGTHNWIYVRKKNFHVSCTWYKSLVRNGSLPLWGWTAVPADPSWWERCAPRRDALDGSLRACRSSCPIPRCDCAWGSARSLTWGWWRSRTTADGCEKHSTIANDAAPLKDRWGPPIDCCPILVPKYVWKVFFMMFVLQR